MPDLGPKGSLFPSLETCPEGNPNLKAVTLSSREPRPASPMNRGPLSPRALSTATPGAPQGRKQPTSGKPCHVAQAGLCHPPSGSARGSTSPLLASELVQQAQPHHRAPTLPSLPFKPSGLPHGSPHQGPVRLFQSNKLCKSPVAPFGSSSLAQCGQAAHGLGARQSMDNEGTACGGGEPQEAWHGEEAPCIEPGLSATTP